MHEGPLFEWDEAKDAANAAKHGISFVAALAIWADPDRREVSTARAHDGEDRSKMLGMIEGKLYTAIFVRRGDKLRLISARRSNSPEAQAYARHNDAGPQRSSSHYA